MTAAPPTVTPRGRRSIPERISSSRKPLAIDLFCGLGGWTDGLLAAGWDAIGFDIHRHEYGSERYPGNLVLQDVTTIHGSQFRKASLIVSSPPCQQYSWLAMPWSRSKSDPKPCRADGCVGGRDVRSEHSKRCDTCDGTGFVENSKAAKALRNKWETEGPDNRLFDACFRIQREAIEATRKRCDWCDGFASGTVHEPSQYVRMLIAEGKAEPQIVRCQRCNGTGTVTRYIPMVVENVRGAQEWVGKAKANYGSFYFWGDVAMVGNRIVAGGMEFGGTMLAPTRGEKNDGGSWFAIAHNTKSGHGKNPVHELAGLKTHGTKGLPDDRAALPDGTGGTSWFGAGKRSDPRDVRRDESGAYAMPDGTKIGGDWFSDPNSTCRKHGSRSSARKAASAQIAKIPFPLAQFIAQSFNPRRKV